MSQCDDDYEHVHGLTIETVDNRGWIVASTGRGRELATRPLARSTRPEEAVTGTTCTSVTLRSSWRARRLNLSGCLTEFRFWAQRPGVRKRPHLPRSARADERASWDGPSSSSLG